jgi:GDPmannose 4,6-dehydratase
VRDFVDSAARALDIKINWDGEGLSEKGYSEEGNCIVRVDPRYFRPTEVETLLGDASKARNTLGWSPKISFEGLVEEMVKEDFDLAKRDMLVLNSGFKAYNRHE